MSASVPALDGDFAELVELLKQGGLDGQAGNKPFVEYYTEYENGMQAANNEVMVKLIEKLKAAPAEEWEGKMEEYLGGAKHESLRKPYDNAKDRKAFIKKFMASPPSTFAKRTGRQGTRHEKVQILSLIHI